MRFRTMFVFLLLLSTVLFAFLNWTAFTTPTTLSLVFGSVQAPIGLVMLGVVFVLGAMCLAAVIYVQGTALVDSRRKTRELQAQRELAESAEGSRYTELRGFIDAELMKITRATSDLRSTMLTRLDQIEQRNHVALQETANAIYAHFDAADAPLDKHLLPTRVAVAERTQPIVGGRIS